MLKLDCKFFSGSRPCSYHKVNGVKCDYCDFYEPIQFKILVIKLDAIGDVLRTMSILPPLKNNYLNSHITWCTRASAKELFRSDNFVDEVITVEDDAYFRLQSEEFEIVINLDTSKLSSSIAAMTSGKKKVGFVLSKKGFVEATSKEAQKWLEMSAFDDEKKRNTKTYQQLIYDILGLEDSVTKPILNIPQTSSEKISGNLTQWHFNSDVITVGLNIGVGTKWPSKAWPSENWESLINHLRGERLNTLLLGGPEEEELLVKLKRKYPFLINTGSDNSLMEFAAIVDLCDFIVTADTLALHIATALEKEIIALFGPTSSSEIDLFGRGIKLSADETCNCYYNKHCSEKVSCMAKITAEEVYKSLKSLIAGNAV